MRKNIFKKTVLWGLVIIGIGLIFSSSLSFAQAESPFYIESTESHPLDPDSLQGKIISAVEKVSPAIVSISTEKTVSATMGFESPQGGSSPFDDFLKRFFEDFPQRSYKAKGLGSGMIFNKDGYILTDEHVIHGVDKDKIKVSLLDGRTLKAKVIEADEETDIAILKIEGDNFPTVIMGDSDNLKIGEFVIAIGNPYGYALSELKKKYEPTATLGIVSAKERAMQAYAGGNQVKTYTNLIQTDASINPGNSGGPLINTYGEVIGINTAIYTPTGSSIGIGFAIPINKAKRLLDSFTKYGKVKWSWIGIYMQPELTKELAKKFKVEKGILVADVVKDSPADKAGIKPGDVIQKINGKEVTSPVELAEEVRKVEIGEKISLVLIRKGKEITLTFTTAERPEEVAKKETEQGKGIEEGKEEELLGMRVESLTPEIREKYNIKESEKGVVVTEVKSGGPADKIGITPGAVIMEVNHKTIEDMDNFEKAIEGIKPGDTVLLRVHQGIWKMFITLQANA